MTAQDATCCFPALMPVTQCPAMQQVYQTGCSWNVHSSKQQGPACRRINCNPSCQHASHHVAATYPSPVHVVFLCACVCTCLLQLYVPSIPGVPAHDDRLVPGRWGFEEEVSARKCNIIRNISVTYMFSSSSSSTAFEKQACCSSSTGSRQ
jgi:hypothetical protein